MNITCQILYKMNSPVNIHGLQVHSIFFAPFHLLPCYFACLPEKHEQKPKHVSEFCKWLRQIMGCTTSFSNCLDACFAFCSNACTPFRLCNFRLEAFASDSWYLKSLLKNSKRALDYLSKAFRSLSILLITAEPSPPAWPSSHGSVHQ